MNLSKALDLINHQRLLETILGYISNRLHCVKINTMFNSFSELIQEVPKGSLLGRGNFNWC